MLLLLDDILQMAISQLQLVQSLLKRWMRCSLKKSPQIRLEYVPWSTKSMAHRIGLLEHGSRLLQLLQFHDQTVPLQTQILDLLLEGELEELKALQFLLQCRRTAALLVAKARRFTVGFEAFAGRRRRRLAIGYLSLRCSRLLGTLGPLGLADRSWAGIGAVGVAVATVRGRRTRLRAFEGCSAKDGCFRSGEVIAV